MRRARCKTTAGKPSPLIGDTLCCRAELTAAKAAAYVGKQCFTNNYKQKQSVVDIIRCNTKRKLIPKQPLKTTTGRAK